MMMFGPLDEVVQESGLVFDLPDLDESVVFVMDDDPARACSAPLRAVDLGMI
jgi:hypothetical protein